MRPAIEQLERLSPEDALRAIRTTMEILRERLIECYTRLWRGDDSCVADMERVKHALYLLIMADAQLEAARRIGPEAYRSMVTLLRGSLEDVVLALGQ